MSDSKPPSTNPGGRADRPAGSDGALPSRIHESPFSVGGQSAARAIDLNADLGEGFPNDRALLALVTSASICCGAHAGDRDTIRKTLRDAPNGEWSSAPIPAIRTATALAAAIRTSPPRK